jgi:hypothetical protein
MTSAKVCGDTEYVCGFRSGTKAPQIGFLDGRAISHRVSERHAKLNDISAAFYQCVEQGRGRIGRRITRSDEADQGCAIRRKGGGEAGSEAGHGLISFTGSSVESCKKAQKNGNGNIA